MVVSVSNLSTNKPISKTDFLTNSLKKFEKNLDFKKIWGQAWLLEWIHMRKAVFEVFLYNNYIIITVYNYCIFRCAFVIIKSWKSLFPAKYSDSIFWFFTSSIPIFFESDSILSLQLILIILCCHSIVYFYSICTFSSFSLLGLFFFLPNISSNRRAVE